MRAIELNYAQLAQVFTRAFEGYAVPLAVDAQSLEQRARVESIDLVASTIADSGVVLVARRGRTSRIAAMGVFSEARGRGVGRTMLADTLAACRARGDARVVLEVIEGNEAAVALYRSAGFAVTRRLVGWARGAVPGSGDLPVEVEPQEVARVLAQSGDDLPWQLAWPSIANLTAPNRGYRLGDAYCVLRDNTLRALVVPTAARRRGHARRLLAALPSPLRVPAIVPETDSFFDFTRETIAQLEMELAL
jgi:ribosomal protein S18 acetylase RimI-like enzyme